VNHASPRGTPLYIAAYVGNAELITLLLDSNAVLDLVGGEFGTALHAACSTGRVHVVALLLKRGAVLKSYLDDGRIISAFERAAHYPRVLEVLRAHKWMLIKGKKDWRKQRHLICQHAGQSLWHFKG
jgi:ankyrin repeat protein